LASFLENQDQVRSIQWGKEYQWDVRFPDAPSPFDKWFPAIDIGEEIAKLETYAFTLYNTSYEIPSHTSLHEVTMTFMDNEKKVLAKWFETWINEEILNLNTTRRVAPLARCVKQIQIQTLDSAKNDIDNRSYWVFPKGSFSRLGTGSGDIIVTPATLVVAGKVA